jgi:hypothetical protein
MRYGCAGTGATSTGTGERIMAENFWHFFWVKQRPGWAAACLGIAAKLVCKQIGMESEESFEVSILVAIATLAIVQERASN